MLASAFGAALVTGAGTAVPAPSPHARRIVLVGLDAAAWSAISGLSEQSVAEGSRPVAVPDFTRGRWKTTPPLTLREA